MLDPQNYYRLPWSLNDNGISWLEVTSRCNLACEGCYRENEKLSDKSLEEISGELAVFKKLRKSDCISIAGGDPLVHPEIVEIVRRIRHEGWKPVLNTNGLALTPELLRELKKAGVFGFTFHIDTSQKRKDSKAATESDHNALREKFAQMLAAEGGISCAFNQTVSSQTLNQVPEVVRWAMQYPDTVNTVVFILFRLPHLLGDFDFYANGEKVSSSITYKETGWGGDKLVKAPDVVAKIREADPEFEPCAYLGGTMDPSSFKWLLGIRLASRRHRFGYASPKFMEFVQEGHHLLKKRYISYASPQSLSQGRLAMLGLSLLDKGMRAAAGRFLKTGLKNPAELFRKCYLQTFTIIQPIDTLPDGRMNMCDGCPDITVYKGQLYWSCRLEEIKRYGCFVSAVPRGVENSSSQSVARSHQTRTTSAPI